MISVRAARAVPLLVAATALLGVRPAAAQLSVSGQIDLLGTTERDSRGLNTAFRGDNPYNPLRLRLFARHWVNDRVGVFTELLYDVDAPPRLNGAYVVLNDLAGGPLLNARLGLAPSSIGSFGLRSTYFNSNPLVGMPLIWHYRTNLSPGGNSTAASLAATTGEPGPGVPLLYDACWNIQWEILGEAGPVEYSIALVPGAVSNPVKARFVDGSQVLARVGYSPMPGLRLGVSGAHGPYLSAPEPDEDGDLPYTADPSDYDQSMAVLDLELGRGRWLIHSELVGARYETPLIAERLVARGGYVEVRFDFTPGWYAAARAGTIAFGDVETEPGVREAWDRDTRRTEIALGYRMSREVLIKVDWQRTTVPDSDFTQDFLALQLSSVF